MMVSKAMVSRRVRTRGLQGLAILCAALLLLLGLGVLWGWATGQSRLETVLPGYASMKPMTAFCFVCCAGSLLATMRRRRSDRTLARLLAGLILLIGLAVGLEYMLHSGFGIDQRPFPDMTGNFFPGRMARITSVLFCLAGMGLFLLQGGRRQRVAAQAAALVVMATAFTGVAGFVFGVRLIYGGSGLEGYYSMALHTGAGFLVLAVGMIAADHHSRLIRVMTAPEAGGMLARRLLPAVILIPLLLGWLFLRTGIEAYGPGLGMALFTGTTVFVAAAVLIGVALYLIRVERQRVAVAEVLRESGAAVAKSERDLRLVTDRLPLLISYFDTDGRYVWVNHTYETWLGRSLADTVGRTIREIVGEPYWEQTGPYRSRAIEEGTVCFESEYPTIRGGRRVQVTYTSDVAEDGVPRGFACMVLDIEDQKRAEAALRQTEKLAVVGRLASSIAHEINNPLEAVTNLLYLVGMDTAGQEPVSSYVAQAQAELGRVTQIVVQTLRFHRQSSSATVCRMRLLSEEVIVLYGGRLTGAGIDVERSYRADVPVTCREGEIRQVVANLIGNAIDAMGKGGRLLVRTQAERGGVSLTVADTGHGMLASVRATLFQPFHTTKGEKGSGLGLWVSKEIVDRHGGTLAVRSREGKGTVFRVWLPGKAE